jgi:hypothetical protein
MFISDFLFRLGLTNQHKTKVAIPDKSNMNKLRNFFVAKVFRKKSIFGIV